MNTAKVRMQEEESEMTQAETESKLVSKKGSAKSRKSKKKGASKSKSRKSTKSKKSKKGKKGASKNKSRTGSVKSKKGKKKPLTKTDTDIASVRASKEELESIQPETEESLAAEKRPSGVSRVSRKTKKGKKGASKSISKARSTKSKKSKKKGASKSKSRKSTKSKKSKKGKKGTNKSKSKTGSTKTAKSKKGKEPKRPLTKKEMDIAKVRAQKEEQERIQREAEESLAAEKRVAAELALRPQQLEQSQVIIESYDRWVLEKEAMLTSTKEWETYTACRNIPDFSKLYEVNSYMSYWLVQLEQPMMKKLMRLSPEYLQLLSEMHDFLTLPPDSIRVDLLRELGLLYRGMIDNQMNYLNKCTYKIIEDITELYDPEVGICDYLLSIPQITHCLWGNIFCCPDIDEHEFKELNFKFKIPESLLTAPGIYRLIKTDYDHYSDSCLSYFAPGVENELKQSILDWVELHSLASEVYTELQSPEDEKVTKGKMGKKKKKKKKRGGSKGKKPKNKESKKVKRGKSKAKSETDDGSGEEGSEGKKVKKKSKKGKKGKKKGKSRGTSDTEDETSDGSGEEGSKSKKLKEKKNKKAKRGKSKARSDSEDETSNDSDETESKVGTGRSRSRTKRGKGRKGKSESRTGSEASKKSKKVKRGKSKGRSDTSGLTSTADGDEESVLEGAGRSRSRTRKKLKKGKSRSRSRKTMKAKKSKSKSRSPLGKNASESRSRTSSATRKTKGGKSESRTRSESAKSKKSKKDASKSKSRSVSPKIKKSKKDASKSRSRSASLKSKKSKKDASKSRSRSGSKKKKKGKKGASKSKSRSRSPSGKGKKKGKKGRSKERPKTEAELAKERERAEKAKFLPQLYEHELNLRNYTILGGVYHFNLLEIPPQPKTRGNWVIHLKEANDELKELPFEADYVAPTPPDQESAKKSPEEMEKEATRQELELQKLVLGNMSTAFSTTSTLPSVVPSFTPIMLSSMPYSAMDVDPEEAAAEALKLKEETKAKYQEEKEKRLTALVAIEVVAPKVGLWFEPPTPVRWDASKRVWSTEGFYDIKFNEGNLQLSFRTVRFGTIAFGHNRWSNLPYQSWEIRPLGKDKVTFSLVAAIAAVEFIVMDNLVCVSSLSNITNGGEVEAALLNKYMTPQLLIKTMRYHGLDIFPDIDSYAYVDGVLVKHLDAEDHLYQCMALVSSAFNFQWSRWSLLAGREKMVYQMRERHGTASPGNYSMVLTTPKKTVRIDCTEVSPNYSEEPAMEYEYYADLINLVTAVGTEEGLIIIEEANPHHIETVRVLLSSIRPLSFS